MHKNVANVEARHALAPESKIVAENRQEAGCTNAKNHVNAVGRKTASDHVGARMPATSRIPVSKVVWEELAGLKKPGETYDHLLEEMIEREKKNRLFEDMDRIEKRGRFVAMKW
jgi:hypothetical protein